MYGRSDVNVKVERGSTFTFTRCFSYIVSILFTHVKPVKVCVRTHAKITWQWKSTWPRCIDGCTDRLTGSGKSLTFHIASFVTKFYKQGDRTKSCRNSLPPYFPLVSPMKDHVSILREKEVKTIVLGLETSETENKEASERVCESRGAI